MTQGAVKTLRLLQIGKESTPGTEVDATARLIGDGHLVDLSSALRPERDFGTLSPVEAPVIVGLLSGIPDFATEASYEQILYPLMCLDEVSGVSGNGAPYTYTFDSPDTSDPDGATFTLEGVAYDGSSNIEQFTATYGLITEFGLSAAFGDNFTEMTANWVARSITAKAPTADPGLPTRNKMPTELWTVKIADTQAGLAGASALAGVVNSFNLSLTGPYRTKRRLNGSLEHAGRALIPTQMTISLVSDLIASIETERTNFRTPAARFLRLAHSIDANHSIQIDMAGHLLTPPTVGEEEGQETRELTYTSFRDATWDQAWQIVVVNELSALP